MLQNFMQGIQLQVKIWDCNGLSSLPCIYCFFTFFSKSIFQLIIQQNYQMTENTPTNKNNPEIPFSNNPHTNSKPYQSNLTYSYSSNKLNENTHIVEEFQELYQGMRTKYEGLRRQFDEVKLQKRKLEIKVMNTNSEYYEKEIKRLRSEVEKYQEENEEHKYQYIKSENSRKQSEASLKVKVEELKNYIKNFESLKISNTELKHSVEEKQRNYNRIREQLEKSNEFITNKFNQTQTKLIAIQAKYKTLHNEHEDLIVKHEKLERKHRQLDTTSIKIKTILEEKIKKLLITIEEQEQLLTKLKISSTAKQRQLSEEVQKYKSERTSVELLTAKKNQTVSSIKSNRILELQVVRAQQKIKELEFKVEQRDQSIKRLEDKIEQLQINQYSNQLSQKLHEAQQQKNNLRIHYEKQVLELNRMISYMKIENTPQKFEPMASKSNNFQQILKAQLSQNANLKKQLSLKIDQIFNLKSDIQHLRVEKDNLKSEIDVLQKMRKSQQKNSKIGSEIQIQNMRNDIESYERKIQLLETKLAYKAKEVKEKDNFIISSIVGRSKKEDVPIIMADLERIFESGYVQKLAEANQKIEELSYRR